MADSQDPLTSVLEALDVAVAVFSASKDLLASTARARSLAPCLATPGSWALGDCSLDSLLHRVLEGPEDVAVETVAVPLAERLEVTARRALGPGPTSLAILTISHAGTQQPPSRAELVGRLLPAIAHELRTPMTTVSGVAQLVGRDRRLPEDLRSYLELARRQVDSADQLLRSASALVRGAASDEDLPQSLGEAVQRALALSAYEARQRSIEVRCLVEDGAPLCGGDPEDLTALVLSVLLALFARLERRGTVRLTVRQEERGLPQLAIEAPADALRTLSATPMPLGERLGVNAEHRPIGDGMGVLTLTIAGSVRTGRTARISVLLADTDLDDLLAWRGELSSIATEIPLATCATVAGRILMRGRLSGAILDQAIARELGGLPLPGLSLITAQRGAERKARSLAASLGHDWSPTKDAPGRLRALLEARAAEPRPT